MLAVLLVGALTAIGIDKRVGANGASIDVWWPTQDAVLTGSQPFKALVQNNQIENYQMYWQVDNGQLNWMDNNYTDYPHKEASVDLSGWSWHGSGPYLLTFVAKDYNGSTIAQRNVSIMVASQVQAALASATLAQAPFQPSSPATQQPTPAAVPGSSQNSSQSPNSNFNSNLNSGAVSQAYSEWKNAYVTQSGTANSNELRVQRPENNNDTVSEGQAYGMLAAVSVNDRNTFDQLWNYAQRYLDARGLMNWQISSSGSVIGSNAATDADEDMAYALMLADQKWGGYSSAAKSMINAIMDNEIESGTNAVKPGDVWGGSANLNISYFAPAYYKAFARFTGNNNWNNVADTAYSVIAKTANPNTGLVPDWSNADGGTASYSFGSNQNNFFYDAVRTPLRLAMDARWNNDSRAKAQLNKMTSFFAGIGADNLKSGYSTSGQPLTSYFDDTFISNIAAGAAASDNQPFSQAINQKNVCQPAGRLLRHIFASNKHSAGSGRFEKLLVPKFVSIKVQAG